jgi:hypothetical protein
LRFKDIVLSVDVSTLQYRTERGLKKTITSRYKTIQILRTKKPNSTMLVVYRKRDKNIGATKKRIVTKIDDN